MAERVVAFKRHVVDAISELVKQLGVSSTDIIVNELSFILLGILLVLLHF